MPLASPEDSFDIPITPAKARVTLARSLAGYGIIEATRIRTPQGSISVEQSPDPVSQPDAYRASLLATLGDEDLAVALGSGRKATT